MSKWMWKQKRVRGLHYEGQVSWDRPEQVTDSSRMLWIERCEKLLSASCQISSYWHTGEPLKLCWVSERVTGLLYFEDRSSGISLPLTLWAEMVQRVEGICHQWAYRWSRGPGRALDPTRRENKTGFQLRPGWYLPFVTLECDCVRLPFPHATSLLWGCFRASRWASEITAVLPLQ